MIKVAGVTFTNTDGGSRQEILKMLDCGFHTARLKQTTYDNERAVEVWIGKKMIGYIPKKELDNPLSYEKEMTAYIKACKQNYIVALSEQQAPTKAQYAYMKKLCANSRMPAYDRRAYALYFSEHKAELNA